LKNPSILREYRVGYILKSHGLKGFVVIKPTTDNLYKRFAQRNILHIEGVGNLIIEKSSIGQKKVLVKFIAIDSIDKTKQLINKEVFMEEESEKIDEFYVDKLLGFGVYDTSGNKLGVLEDIDITGPQHKIIFSKVILPFVKELVPIVNLSERYIVVNMPDGIDKL
jgi:16S rRNA processing protein RimM